MERVTSAPDGMASSVPVAPPASAPVALGSVAFGSAAETRSGNRHAARTPSPTGGGTVVTQIDGSGSVSRSQQRGWNGQPGGGEARLGGSPWISAGRAWPPTSGTAASNARE